MGKPYFASIYLYIRILFYKGHQVKSNEEGAKRVKVEQFPAQGRYGQGVAAWKLPGKTRVVGMAIGKGTVKVTVFLEKRAPKSVRLDEAPLQGRPARGKRVVEVKAGDRVVGLGS